MKKRGEWMIGILKERLFTDRLTLTSPYAEDSEKLLTFHVHNREFHAPFEYKKQNDFYTPGSIKKLLQQQIHEKDAKRGLYFTLSLKGSEEVIGSISCSNIVWGPFCSTFLGYRLSHNSINHGYMSEALASVIDFGCSTYNLHRFEANIMPGNHPSIHLVESLGFRHEGYSPAYLYIDGGWEGHNHYVYINPNWKL